MDYIEPNVSGDEADAVFSEPELESLICYERYNGVIEAKRFLFFAFWSAFHLLSATVIQKAAF